MHEDDSGFTNVPGEHPADELGCMVVAIYAAAASTGLLILLGCIVWLGWWPGLIILGAIVGVALILWALLRMGARKR